LFWLSLLAGSRPGGRLTFFCSAKRKLAKKKRAGCVVPSLRYGHAALLAPRGVWLNSLRSDNASPDPPVNALLADA
jgi:hypothetical protein